MFFGITLTTYLSLFRYSIESELSLTNWGLHWKRVPDKGLIVLAHIGPLSVYIYDMVKQDEWFNQLVERGKDEEVEE